MMIYFRYFILNLLWFNCLPSIIKSDDEEWYCVVNRDKKRWYIDYFKFVGKETKEMIKVSSKSSYIAYLKMVHKLWKNRKKVKITTKRIECYHDILRD